ncbi:MAG: methionine gamma-lyase family protein [Clostridia bacterium]|nr:methionine gamma-lyase family protein [Clostridia bacterium]
MNKRKKMLQFDDKLLSLADQTEADLKEVFGKIDRLAFFNQKKVLEAFREERVSTECFNPTTGYGYDDMGREVLDRIYARVFEAESAFVRHSILSGTHALTLALFGLLRPGDTMLAVTGTPYDTLQSVIGLTGEAGCGSLKDFGIRYEEIQLSADSELDRNAIADRLQKSDVKMVYLQKSPGYSTRRPLGNQMIAEAVRLVKEAGSSAFVVVDNCYAEFCEEHEPPYYGADLCIGSLIKNPGGGMAECGGYLAGTKKAIDLCAQRYSCPGIGLEIGASLGNTKAMFKGLFYAPHTVSQALKTAVFSAGLFEKMGYRVIPSPEEARYDIVQQISLLDGKKVEGFCKGLQSASPVDSFVTPIPWAMPGYQDPVIMAAGAFTQGSSIELSADAPMRHPFTVYMQGGLTYESAKLGILAAASEVMAIEE